MSTFDYGSIPGKDEKMESKLADMLNENCDFKTRPGGQPWTASDVHEDRPFCYKRPGCVFYSVGLCFQCRITKKYYFREQGPRVLDQRIKDLDYKKKVLTKISEDLKTIIKE